MQSIKEIRYTGRARKDLKRYRHNISLMQELQNVLKTLSIGKKLDDSYRPHKLTGDYKGCMECHVGSDFLLIWIDVDYIEVVRVGSHSELFD